MYVDTDIGHEVVHEKVHVGAFAPWYTRAPYACNLVHGCRRDEHGAGYAPTEHLRPREHNAHAWGRGSHETREPQARSQGQQEHARTECERSTRDTSTMTRGSKNNLSNA